MHTRDLETLTLTAVKKKTLTLKNTEPAEIGQSAVFYFLVRGSMSLPAGTALRRLCAAAEQPNQTPAQRRPRALSPWALLLPDPARPRARG